jgi:SagB-type dehydrogenase family enzyme
MVIMADEFSGLRPSLAPTELFVRLHPSISVGRTVRGTIEALVGQTKVDLGECGSEVDDAIRTLRTGISIDRLSVPGPLSSATRFQHFARILIARRLAQFVLGADGGRCELAVIEPAAGGRWLEIRRLEPDTSVIVSPFALIRRRRNELIAESPLSPFVVCLKDAALIATLTSLVSAKSAIEIACDERSSADVFAVEVLLATGIICRSDPAQARECPAGSEGWEFHDLLFHARSRLGRHANRSGRRSSGAVGAVPPSIRPLWLGKSVPLERPDASANAFEAICNRRKSQRQWDDEHPIDVRTLSAFLFRAARVKSRSSARPGDVSERSFDVTSRPYASGGATYPLELYLAVDRCAGLQRGLYHFEPTNHALEAISGDEEAVRALLDDAKASLASSSVPQILIIIAARFARALLNYNSIAYALILKEVGILMHQFYLLAADMRLSACSLGNGDIELFARATGLNPLVEGSVGEFAIGSAVHGCD